MSIDVVDLRMFYITVTNEINFSLLIAWVRELQRIALFTPFFSIYKSRS